MAAERGSIEKGEEVAFGLSRQIAMKELPTGGPREGVIAEKKEKKHLAEAEKELEILLTKKSDQVKRYGGELTGHLLLRYQLVYCFFLIAK